MITITRAQVRMLRHVLRKTVPVGTPRRYRPPVSFHSDDDGLRVRFNLGEAAAEWHLPGPPSACQCAIPGEALNDFEGSSSTNVTLELHGEKVTAQWDDGGMPQTREYPAIAMEHLAPFPTQLRNSAVMDASLLKALDDAAQITAQDGSRPALSRLQLRAKTGEIAATNGRHLLLQRGFAFPWQDSVLIPTIGVFGAKEVLPVESVRVGRTDTQVCLAIGAWTFFLLIDVIGKFPRIETAIPTQFTKGPSFQLAAEDAQFLLEKLPLLPGHGNPDEAVTIVLNGGVVLRDGNEGKKQITELILNRSTSSGAATTFVVDRESLTRALRMGFTEFFVKRPEAPIVARDRRRLFVWAPLNPESAIPASSKAIRVESAEESSPASHQPPMSRRIPTMPAPNHNGHGNGSTTTNGERTERAPTIDDLIAEAEELRNVLADASTRVSRFLSALKQQRRQSRAMHQAMQSLKQLQLDG